NAVSLRKAMTKEERRLWYDYLKNYEIRFLRQKVIDKYIADFYCSKAKLVIEIDGTHHFEEEGKVKDAVRTESFENRGLKVIRISNYDIWNNFTGVCESIDRVVKESLLV
ncbi:MAG: endonuclease domain-containing protein, partial [Clostridia bacterium]